MCVVGIESPRSECNSCDVKPVVAKKHKPSPEQEAATSTTPTEILLPTPVAANKIPAPEWGVEEVIQFIMSADPKLGEHADLFRTHVSNLYNVKS